MGKSKWLHAALLFLILPALLFGGNSDRGATPRAAASPVETSFTTPYNISNSPDYTTTQHPRAAANPTDYLHVTWMEGNDGAYGPAYVRGQYQNWPAWEWAASPNNQGYTNPAIAQDGAGAVHLVWSASTSGNPPYDIWYASKPAGGSWSAPINLSNDGDNTVYPDIAVDSLGNIWVVWQVTYGNGDTDVNGRYKPAGGPWGTITQIGYSGAQDQNPRIAIDGTNTPHVVWRNNSISDNWEILYSKYVNGHWTGAANISATGSHSYFPAIAASGSNVYVAWEDEIGGQDVFQILVRRWDGAQWQPWKQASLTSKALFPAIAADGGTVHTVWQDHRGGTLEIYYSHSTDYGVTWLGDENVSRNSTSSYFPDIVGQAGGVAHIFWEDIAPGQLDIFYSRAGSAPSLPPQGAVTILAHDPPGDTDYTRLLTTTLHLPASSPGGWPITEMRVCNVGNCSPPPAWVAYTPWNESWRLLDSGHGCEYKWVNAWFKDSNGLVSITATDYIRYDGYLTASMSLNDGCAYTNRLTVTVGSMDLDALQPDCSGLQSMRLSQDGVAYSDWFTFTPSVAYALDAAGPPVRTVYAQYKDRAGNSGTFSDQVTLDTTPPYSGSAPTLPVSTTSLVITVSGLLAYDDGAGVERVWLAKGPAGPWCPLTYAPPPHDYRWSLACGGPPPAGPVTLTVYVKYEDAAGCGDSPGNFSGVYSSTLRFEGVVFSTYLPLVHR